MFDPTHGVRRLDMNVTPPKTVSANPFKHIPPPCRQLHPPKSPLYRPAVLRASAHSRPGTASASPSTSPKLITSDFSVVYNKPEADYISDDFDDHDLGVDIYEEEEEVGKVTGPPRRTHWKPDAEAPVCDAPTCIKEFSFYNRKHHCRRCGNVFCSQHAYQFLPLNQNSRVHPQGVASRVCDTCFSEYRRVRRAAAAAARRTSSLSSSSTSSSSSSTSSFSSSSPLTAMSRPISRPMDQSGLAGKIGSYVGSVPRDWSWSTF